MQNRPSRLTPNFIALGIVLAGGTALAADPNATPPPVTITPTVAAPVQGGADEDTVRLSDGSTLRGRIAERRADGSLVIVLATGEVRTIAAAQIVSVSLASMQPPPVVPQGYVAPMVVDNGPALSLRPFPGRIPLVLESTGAPLQVGTPSGGGVAVFGNVTPGGHTACSTPCTVYVRPGTISLWSGGEDRRTEIVPVSVTGAGARVRLHSSSYSAYNWGMRSVWSSALGTALGAGVLIYGLAASTGSASLNTYALTGGLFLGFGVVGLAISIPLIVLNPVGIESQQALGAPPGTAAPVAMRRHRSERPMQWAVNGGPIEGGAYGSFALVF